MSQRNFCACIPGTATFNTQTPFLGVFECPNLSPEGVPEGGPLLGGGLLASGPLPLPGGARRLERLPGLWGPLAQGPSTPPGATGGGGGGWGGLNWVTLGGFSLWCRVTDPRMPRGPARKEDTHMHQKHPFCLMSWTCINPCVRRSDEIWRSSKRSYSGPFCPSVALRESFAMDGGRVPDSCCESLRKEDTVE